MSVLDMDLSSTLTPEKKFSRLLLEKLHSQLFAEHVGFIALYHFIILNCPVSVKCAFSYQHSFHFIGLGDKQHPIHILTEHGCIPVQGLSEISYERIRNWFESCKYSRVEGVVWHLPEGRMFKLHRHHLKLRWPLPDDELPLLSTLTTRIICKTENSANYPPKSMFHVFNKFDRQHFDKLCDIGKSNFISSDGSV